MPPLNNAILAALICVSVGAMLHGKQWHEPLVKQQRPPDRELTEAYLTDAADLFELGRQVERHRRARDGL